MRRLSRYVAASIVVHGILLGTVLYLERASEHSIPPAADMAFDIVRDTATPTSPPSENLAARPEIRIDPRPAPPPEDTPLEAPPKRLPQTEQVAPAREPEDAVDFRTHRPLTTFLGTPSPGPSGASGVGGPPSGGGSTTGTFRYSA
jgi:hypothetical protein